MFSIVENTKYVDSIDFYMNETYIESVYNSCKNVITPSSGALAMDFACGRHGSKQCTAKKWVSNFEPKFRDSIPRSN